MGRRRIDATQRLTGPGWRIEKHAGLVVFSMNGMPADAEVTIPAGWTPSSITEAPIMAGPAEAGAIPPSVAVWPTGRVAVLRATEKCYGQIAWLAP